MCVLARTCLCGWVQLGDVYFVMGVGVTVYVWVVDLDVNGM